ncbi:ASCH domain-containing protein [Microbacterium sp.]|uniref:ASCH domain-containing protein n=1 Tax=Microbacterium sp. TaxID=51671 RepID=UPI003A8AAB2E
MDGPYPVLELVPPGRLRDRLVAAVLAGQKTATTRLEVLDTLAGTPAEADGAVLRLLDSEGDTAAHVQVTAVHRLAPSAVDDDLATKDGSWFGGAAAWREAHLTYWRTFVDDARAASGDPAWTLDANTAVVVWCFQLWRMP